MSGSYDLCLIFGGAPGFARRVDAKVKAAWVRTDWSHYRPIRFLARRQFADVDYIVNVSDEAKKAFDNVVGEMPGIRSVVVENCLSPTWIKMKANEFAVEEGHGLKILSVGRVTPQKTTFGHWKPRKSLRNSEGYSMSFVESAVLGTPIVSYDNGGIRDIVNSPELGLICTENTPERLAEGIMRFVDSSVRRVNGSFAHAQKRWHEMYVEKVRQLILG